MSGDTEGEQCNGAESEDNDEMPTQTNIDQPCHRLTPDELDRPTSELYEAKHLAQDEPKNDTSNFTGKYKHLRAKLDYSYHKVPNKSRQLLQDTLIDWFDAQRSEECTGCKEPPGPVVLFTAGAMASGKGHTLRQFLQSGEVSLPEDFIWIDPDKISRHLPERKQYLEYDQDNAPERLHAEASMVQELLTLHARETRRSFVVDGSLSDGDWYKTVMRDLRDDGYSIEIFFVFADMPIMEKRAKQREKDTGRQTDIEQIRRTAEAAPKSVEKLAKKEHVDRVRMVDNSSNDKPPHMVYDSKGDACFEKEGKTVDVMKWIRKELESDEHKQ